MRYRPDIKSRLHNGTRYQNFLPQIITYLKWLNIDVG